jgi:hypothetical protein
MRNIRGQYTVISVLKAMIAKLLKVVCKMGTMLKKY